MITYDPKNWLRVLFDFPKSPVFRTLFLDVLGAGAWAALVVWVETDLVRVAVPLGPSFLSILGIILGLLLVFRTNTAYDRWWEGRRLWGQLVNVSRGISQQLGAQLAGPEHQARRARYAELLAAYPAQLAVHLRQPLTADGAHVPNATMRDVHAAVQADLATGRLAPESRIALAPLLQAFDDVTGACERIRKTPIPFSYSVYIKQFVVLYAFIMPFGLVREFGYGTVIASMFTFFATMGLELLATEIEEPFGTDINDLPLDQIAATIARDVRNILTPGSSATSV
ncbi:MAG: bestrophin family protein [Gemmatimonadaceae bacterium]